MYGRVSHFRVRIGVRVGVRVRIMSRVRATVRVRVRTRHVSPKAYYRRIRARWSYITVTPTA